MPGSFVFFIEVYGIVGIDLPHKQREILGGCLQEYMVMVIHQAVVMYVYFVDTACFAEYLQEFFFIFIASVNIRACYTSINNMMKSIQV